MPRKITEFWRRWHISLSTWFRDYLYIPLGGNRRGAFRTYFNLMVVFLLCGLWHGASWTFLVWGVVQGLFLILERVGFGKVLGKTGPLANLYTMLVVMFAWVIFRSDTLTQAWGFIQVMMGAGGNWDLTPALQSVISRYHLLVLGVSVIAAIPVGPAIACQIRRLSEKKPNLRPFFRPTLELAQFAGIQLQFAWCICLVFSSTYNPFIYFRF